MRQRPILTMLSGPAAGVAGALMYERVSYGIFLEVGGTSTDMSAIKDGNVMIEYAEVGGHRTYLRSLDTRTIGLAGGSMVAIKDGEITDVGPRSAHIAGLPYAVFAQDDLDEPTLFFVSPRPGDPQYAGIETRDGRRYALTLTCAANILGLTQAGDTAHGQPERARQGFLPLAAHLGISPEEAAAQILDKAAGKVMPVIKALRAKYKLDPDSLLLVGGGGGAAAIVPYVSRKLGLPFKMAANADVISSIGVALAMVRDMIEQSMIDPTPEDVLRLRKAAENRVIGMGADPASVEVQVEIEKNKNIVRAIAIGALAMRKKDHSHLLSQDERKKIAAANMGAPPEKVELLGATALLTAFGCPQVKKALFGLMKSVRRPARVVDGDGIIRLSNPDAQVFQAKRQDIMARLPDMIRQSSKFGDGGQAAPDVFFLIGGKIINFSGMQDVEQIKALADVELAGRDGEENIVAIMGMKDV
jgi:hypothetical protein